METKKAVIIGDGYVGKTCILHALRDETFSDQLPNIYEEFVTEEKVLDNKMVRIKFVDTAGQEEYNEIRKLTYRDVDMFLICFAIDDQVSFDNITSTWITDIQQHTNVPILLVGSKSDLRSSNHSCITKAMIKSLQKEIRAVAYVECSAKTLNGIAELRKIAIKILYDNERKKNCVIQ